jgi:tyrosine-protein kinase Etk/Wzc
MDTSTENVRQEEGFNFRKYIIKILANWPLFVLSIGIAYAIAFLVNRYTEPTFSVSTSLIITDEKKSSAEMLISSLDRFNLRKNVENEIATLRSYELTFQTIKELDLNISYYIIGRVREPKLYKSCPFTIELDTAAQTLYNLPVYVTLLNNTECEIEVKEYNIRKKLQFGEHFIHHSFNFTIIRNKSVNQAIDNASNKYYFVVNNLGYLTKLYAGKLNISSPEKRGSLVTLSTTGPVALEEADYLNKLCEVYIRTNLEEKNKAAINTIRFIDDQLSSIADSLRKAELRLQDFRLENRVVDISMEGNAIFSRIQKLQTDKVDLQMQQNYFLYLKRYVDDKKDFIDVIAPSMMGVTEPLLNNEVVELIDLFKQRAVLFYNAQNTNPSVNIIDLKIQKNIDALKENIKEVIYANNANIKSLEKRIFEEENEMLKLPVTERRLINLKREFDVNNNIFNFLLQKRAEAGIAKASNIPDSKVIDHARAENAVQIAPKRSKNYTTALFIGLLIPLVIIFLTEMFNTRITDLKELDNIADCAVIGTIGHNEKLSELPVFENPKSSLSESFRSLRTNLQYILREKNEKIIVVTSTISGEGKTFCSVNLATILAMSNKKTILVSLDLRKPKVHKVFNYTNDKGLSTYLINRDKIEDIIFPTNINNLFIATSGPVPPNPAELLETKEMADFIKYCRKEFDYIILDTPPVAIVTDALLLTQYADATVFVVRQNYSSKEVINLAQDMAKKAGIKHLSLLVNDVKVSGYYGYSYKYGYRYGYNYGYNYGYGYDYTYGHDYYGEEIAQPTWKDKIVKLFRM